MFAAFNLDLKFSDISFDYFYKDGLEILNEQKRVVHESLEKYVCNNECIDGTKLQENWFPQIQCDVFLSHSHKDEKWVVSFAGWLYKVLGLVTFVDSHIWGYSKHLLKELDNKYCVKKIENGHTTYSYEKRNITTGHVDIMLAMGLCKMLDNTEALFFINTPNSIFVEELSSDQTLSPWIYAEIQMANIIRKKKLSNYRDEVISKSLYHEQSDLKIKYDVELNKFITLTKSDLLYMWKYSQAEENSLDLLYKLKGII